MKKDDSGWKIVPGQVPAWVTGNEKSFHDLIEEELEQAS